MAGLFLGLVKRALTAEPSAESLLTLLQLADPDLTLQDVEAKADRDRLIRQLRLAVHPDRQDAKDDATDDDFLRPMRQRRFLCEDQGLLRSGI
jgi:hypothetical protein